MAKPLRTRRDGQMSRITEGRARWRVAGIDGAGLAECLDQTDGRPVGIAAGS